MTPLIHRSPICCDDVLPEVDAVDKGGRDRRRVAVHKTGVGGCVADRRAVDAAIHLREEEQKYRLQCLQ